MNVHKKCKPLTQCRRPDRRIWARLTVKRFFEIVRGPSLLNISRVSHFENGETLSLSEGHMKSCPHPVWQRSNVEGYFCSFKRDMEFLGQDQWMPLVNVWNRIWSNIFSFGRHGQKTWIHLVAAGAALQEKGLMPLFRPFGLIKSCKRSGAVSGPCYFLSILYSGLWVGDFQFPAKDNRLRWRNKWITKVMILFRFHFLCLLCFWLNLAAKRLLERESGRVIEWLQFESFQRQIKL